MSRLIRQFQCFLRLSKIFESYMDKIKEDLEETFKFDTSELRKNKDKINQLVLQITYCLQPMVRQYISIFHLTSDNDLIETIFQSICECKSKRMLFCSPNFN